jgi:hypothetical protein
MNLVQMTRRFSLGHKGTNALIKGAFDQQIWAGVLTTLVFYRWPLVKSSGCIEPYMVVSGQSCIPSSTRRVFATNREQA